MAAMEIAAMDPPPAIDFAPFQALWQTAAKLRVYSGTRAVMER
jgi:hypothetical protein